MKKCILCGSKINIIQYKGKWVCEDCIRYIKIQTKNKKK